MDSHLELIFDRLDKWRHLPAYRLEPRADLFFAVFMPEIIKAKFDVAIREPIIPEFPFRRGTIYGEQTEGPNASVKVDYLVVSDDGSRVFFVELKTDMASFRPKQDKYLDKAIEAGIPLLINGVLSIIDATNREYLPKYMHLLDMLNRLGWIRLPDGLTGKVCVENPPSAAMWKDRIEILPNTELSPPEKVYILPERKNGYNCISFQDVAEVAAANGSQVGEIFAKYLERWITKAGIYDPN